MRISLTPDQQAWIASHVERGEFASIDEAARQLIDERIAERMIAEDDLAWAKPLVTNATLAEVAFGLNEGMMVRAVAMESARGDEAAIP
jgi:antitoxin ParD1/3/4